MHVPFLNLNLQYQSLKTEIDLAIANTISTSQFIKGPDVTAFEQAFAKKLNIPHCIGVGNGTDALFVALKALNIGPGDEVITTAYSWISASECISLCGATPVFTDLDAVTFNSTPEEITRKISSKTKAVIVTHLYGQAAEISAVKSICEANNLFLIEDCAQAHLTAENGQYAGTFGDIGTFSFYPTKNLGAFGDAGCVVTPSTELAEKMRRFANHGALKKNDHLFDGVNSRLDTLQAAILQIKLPHLEAWNNRRNEHAHHYAESLADLPEVITPIVRPNTLHTFHQYVIRARKRDELREFLAKHQIETQIHYPKALPNLGVYNHLNTTGKFPVATRLQDEILSLPIVPELTTDQIAYVCEKIKAFY